MGRLWYFFQFAYSFQVSLPSSLIFRTKYAYDEASIIIHNLICYDSVFVYNALQRSILKIHQFVMLFAKTAHLLNSLLKRSAQHSFWNVYFDANSHARNFTSTETNYFTLRDFYEPEKFHHLPWRSKARNQPVGWLFFILFLPPFSGFAKRIILTELLTCQDVVFSVYRALKYTMSE